MTRKYEFAVNLKCSISLMLSYKKLGVLKRRKVSGQRTCHFVFMYLSRPANLWYQEKTNSSDIFSRTLL